MNEETESVPVEDPGEARVWLLIGGPIPERWQARAVPLSLVPLVPDEARELLEGTATRSVSEEEESFARLVAQGYSAEEIARRLHLTPRTVYRRLARLRARVGARNLTELAARLSRQGF